MAFDGALGTPSSGTVTNLTGTASININGTVGATTPAAGTFTTLQSNGNTTVGDASGDTLTINAAAWTMPNGITWTKTAQSSTQETILDCRVSDDAAARFVVENASSTDGVFAPRFLGIHGGAGPGLNFQGRGTTDTGTNGCLQFTGQIGTSDATVRPVMTFFHRATLMAQFSFGNNLQLTTATTGKTLASAAADTVSIADVDNGAGNRELQVQPESGGKFAWGANQFRRIPSATQEVDHITTTVNTTDGTQTTLATVAITASATYIIEAIVNARRTGGSSGTADDGGSWVRRGTYTTKSGTVTLMGSVQTIGTDAEDQAGWDVTFTISSTNVLLRVTGASNNNVTWMGNLLVQKVAS